MNIFLSFKNKMQKIIFFAILFFVFLGVMVPKPVNAGFWCNVLNLTSPLVGTTTGCNPVDTAKDVYNSTIGQLVTNTALELATGVLMGVSDLIYYIGYSIGWLGTYIFGLAINILNWPITTDPVFLQGWSIIRDLSNMFIVLGFVMVGIAFTLRLEGYGTKKVLISLILTALLINFSGLLCGITIDASNIIVKSFTGGGVLSASGEQLTIFNTISKRVNDTFNDNNLRNDVSSYVKADIEFSLIFILIGAIFFYLSVILIARYGVLALLFILSPLAFVARIFPASQNIWKEWSNNFIKWVFIGVGSSFFIWVSSKVLEGQLSSNSGNLSDTGLLVVLLILLVGFKISTKSSATGAAAVLGLASGAVGFAMGAVKAGGMGTLKGLSNATGASRAGQWASNKAGQTLERLRLKSEGSTAGARDKERETTAKNVASLTEDRKTQLARGIGIMGGGHTREGADKREAAIRDKIANNNLGDLGDISAQHNALVWLESRERSRGIGKAGELSTARRTAAKANPLISGMDSDYVAEESRKAIAAGKPAVTVQDINIKEVKKHWNSMNAFARSKINLYDAAQFNHADAESFAMDHNSDVIEAARALPTGSIERASYRAFLRNMIDMASITPVAGSTKKVDEAANNADAAGDINTNREMKKFKNKILSILP